MRTPLLTPLAASLPPTVPFVGPERQERARGRPFRARIGANESVFGPSPAAIAAMQAAAPEAWMYGDPDNHDLRAALAASLGVAPACIVIGEGIDGLLGLTVRLFAGPGEPVVTSAGAYPTFTYHVAGFGARAVTVPYRGDAEDPDALLAAAETGARLLYLANPDNPMGSWHPAGRIAETIARLPGGCLLCLDEAYLEFAPEGTAPPLDPENQPQVIRFRTFSKAHGLAGMRIGYAIAHPEVAAAFDRVRNHFGMTRLGQAAAIAALGDAGHLAAVRAKVLAARAEIGAIAAANGLAALPSATNFVAVDCGRDGAFARRVLAELIARDVFARMPGVSPLDRCIRLSAGTPADLAVLAEELPRALAAARAAGA